MNIVRKIYYLYLNRRNTVKWARKLGVTVGNNTMIAPTVSFSSEPYLISIGNNVQITDNVSFNTHGGGNVIRKTIPDFDMFGKVVVCDYAYIGSHTIILPGVTIGEGALVAAGSVVTKSVSPGVVVGGNPAKEICSVAEFIQKNLRYNLSTKGLSFEAKKAVLLKSPEDKFISK